MLKNVNPESDDERLNISPYFMVWCEGRYTKNQNQQQSIKQTVVDMSFSIDKQASWWPLNHEIKTDKYMHAQYKYADTVLNSEWKNVNSIGRSKKVSNGEVAP